MVYLIPFSSLNSVARLLRVILTPFAQRAFVRIYNNIEDIYPELHGAEKKQFAKDTLTHVLRVTLEIMQARKFRKKKFILKYVSTDSKELETIFSGKDRGIVCVQGHFGNWEIPVAYYSHMGVKISYSMQKLSNPYVNRQVENRRKNYGARGIYSDDVSSLVRSINKKNKNLLGLVADQNAGDQGIFVDFFGKPASTHAGPAVLAYLAETEISVLTCRYLGKGKYKISVDMVVNELKRSDYPSKEEAIKEITQAWSTALEKRIRAYPRQYFWVHRRWKTQPPPSF